MLSSLLHPCKISLAQENITFHVFYNRMNSLASIFCGTKFLYYTFPLLCLLSLTLFSFHVSFLMLLFGGEGHTSCAQNQLLALCSRITPGYFQRTLCDVGNQA